MTYRFLSPALVELSEAAEYYKGKVPGLGEDFIERADETIERIINYPEAWGKISENYRHCNFQRFPYTVIYSIQNENEILIISVFHQNREPMTWQRNL